MKETEDGKRTTGDGNVGLRSPVLGLLRSSVSGLTNQIRGGGDDVITVELADGTFSDELVFTGYLTDEGQETGGERDGGREMGDGGPETEDRRWKTGDGRPEMEDRRRKTGDRRAMTKQRPVYKFQQLGVYQLALEYVDHSDLRLRISDCGL